MNRLYLTVVLAVPLVAGSVRVYQTNSAGDEVDVIDPGTNKIVLRIPDVEVGHGVAFSPDGARAYLTVEADSTLLATDTRSGARVGSVALSGHPNNVAVSKDGRYAFVAIVQAPGAVDVVDTAAMKLVKTVRTKGGVHNTYVTPDGKFAIAGSIVGKLVTVIDAKTFAPVWEIPFDQGVRPIAIEKGADGSASRLFVQLSNVHGFAVVDFETHEEVTRIMLPKEPAGGVIHSAAPSHGIGIAPDGKTLWVNSSVANSVFVYSLPELKPLGYVKVGKTPDWLTFTPDSTRIYVANAGSNSVSAIDAVARKEVARIPVGEVPKRNGTVTVP